MILNNCYKNIINPFRKLQGFYKNQEGIGMKFFSLFFTHRSTKSAEFKNKNGLTTPSNISIRRGTFQSYNGLFIFL